MSKVKNVLFFTDGTPRGAMCIDTDTGQPIQGIHTVEFRQGWQGKDHNTMGEMVLHVYPKKFEFKGAAKIVEDPETFLFSQSDVEAITASFCAWAFKVGQQSEVLRMTFDDFREICVSQFNATIEAHKKLKAKI